MLMIDHDGAMTLPDHDHPQRAAKAHLWMHFTRMSAYQKADVPVIVRGEGPYIWDDQGRRYLDAYNNVVSLGHSHPRVVEAIQKQLEAEAARPLLDWRLDYWTVWPHVKNLIPHQSIYNFGRMQEVWLDK